MYIVGVDAFPLQNYLRERVIVLCFCILPVLFAFSVGFKVHPRKAHEEGEGVDI